MGLVFEALDVAGGRPVALKVLRQRAAPAQLERFRREGELTARLDHPHVLRVHGAGEVAGYPYLAYELVPGAQTLDEVSPTLAPADRIELFRQVCAGVAAGHAQGVVHRDLKPQNVLVDAEGRAKVGDFGVATAGDLERLTQSGTLVGTPHYMAPEALSGISSGGPTVDVWSLGVILHELLADELPFQGANLVELIGAATAGAPPSVPSLPGLSMEPLRAILAQALALDPLDRYPDAGALAGDLLASASGSRVAALEVRRSRRARRLLGVLALLAVLALGATIGWSVTQRRSADADLAALSRDLDLLEQTPWLGREAGSAAELASRALSQANTSPEAAQVAERARSLAGLAQLAAGQVDEARLHAEALTDPSPLRVLLRSALALEANMSSADGYRGLDLELPWQELTLWRAWSELEAGACERVTALRLAKLAERGGPRWAELELRLHLAGGDLARAEQLSTQLTRLGAGAREALDLAQVRALYPEHSAAALTRAQRVWSTRSLPEREVLGAELAAFLSGRLPHPTPESLPRLRDWAQLLLALGASARPAASGAIAVAAAYESDDPVCEELLGDLSRLLPRDWPFHERAFTPATMRSPGAAERRRFLPIYLNAPHCAPPLNLPQVLRASIRGAREADQPQLGIALWTELKGALRPLDRDLSVWEYCLCLRDSGQERAAYELLVAEQARQPEVIPPDHEVWIAVLGIHLELLEDPVAAVRACLTRRSFQTSDAALLALGLTWVSFRQELAAELEANAEPLIDECGFSRFPAGWRARQAHLALKRSDSEGALALIAAEQRATPALARALKKVVAELEAGRMGRARTTLRDALDQVDRSGTGFGRIHDWIRRAKTAQARSSRAKKAAIRSSR